MNKLQTIQKGLSIQGQSLTENEVLSGIMKAAWALAKQAVIEHEGKASEYIAESMKVMWNGMYTQSLGLIKKKHLNDTATERAERVTHNLKSKYTPNYNRKSS